MYTDFAESLGRRGVDDTGAVILSMAVNWCIARSRTIGGPRRAWPAPQVTSAL